MGRETPAAPSPIVNRSRMANDKHSMINGSPTKRFFIEILTRDISVSAAILDLVDNAVDSAATLKHRGDFSDIEIRITANSQEFSIADNAAGIGVENAKNYVFRMGRPHDVQPSDSSIGQFGVGMKRALFKLGRAFEVESHTVDDRFTVNVDVSEWMKDDSSWYFPIDEQIATDRSTGTKITVRRLHSQIKDAFNDESFINEIIDDIRSRHRLAMGNGLNLYVNEQLVKPADSAVAFSDEVKPAIRTFTINSDDGAQLEVEIVAGIAPKHASGVDEDAEPESQSQPASDAGWLVFGNGRLLLANDKTKITGWGTGRNNLPQYHNQYARFRGFVYMRARDSSAIPWNTMKTGVDADSSAWHTILIQMIQAARSVIQMLNLAKAERQLANGEMATPILNAIENTTSIQADEVVEVHFSMHVHDLRSGFNSDAEHPPPNADLIESWKKIQYSVLTEAFDEVSAAVGTESAAEIGRASFETYRSINVGT